MATAVPAKKSAAYIFYTGLVSQTDGRLLKANPTLAAGDFKVSIDGGAFANLGTLPTVSPAAGTAVKVTLASSETNGDNIVVTCIDAAGAEWCDQLVEIQTAARQLDDHAFPNTSGRGMVVDANGLVDATTVKIGPTGAATAQSAGDVPAKTSSLTFTVAGQVDANIQSVNDITVNGAGSTGSPWGP